MMGELLVPQLVVERSDGLGGDHLQLVDLQVVVRYVPLEVLLPVSLLNLPH